MSRPFEMGVIIFSFSLFGFLLARFAAPIFDLLPSCTFRNLFGIPCPSCGMTRAGLALARGKLKTAFTLNPLFVIGLGSMLIWSAARTIEWWRGNSSCSDLLTKMLNYAGIATDQAKFEAWQRQLLRWLTIGAIFFNWLYLIATSQ
ncbi:MAG: DUF2752 domain-containing protein [candidate division KSB1 bacterium]|nr:DUF2752 domain-containing protein [candidate division KSB1 bacterium]MDZ7304510.1 DUF2752 domain-containing protein [candidate division KSB1 bacterium]MDZ7313890.1 DUF2752 domain-containing protein [candidate division KSB1 bacterium]